MSDKNVINSNCSTMPRDIRKAGVLKKLKTMKKKYFVLRTESDSGPARLEYYDNEKKFRSGCPAKRSILIKPCFNINRKLDAKHKLAIALYTKDDCFSVVADTENVREDWLNALLELQLDSPCMNGGAKLKPKFEHVWQVTVGDKSLASSRNMKGIYRLCLTPSALALIKAEPSENPETLELSLMSIRRLGHTNNYFIIELGRSSVTGAGELWLETEDIVIAQNIHEVTLNAMKTCQKHEDLGPLARPRSASNSENNRPISTRRPVAVVIPQAISYTGIRDRCDSMPTRSRTISEGQENNRPYYNPPGHIDSLRIHGGFSRTVSYSPPGISNPLSPVSATCSTDSAGSSLSIDEFDAGQQTDFTHARYIHSHPTDGVLHTEPPIKEEQLDEYVPMSLGSNNSYTDGYLTMAPMSSSAPTGPAGIYLHLNSADSGHLPSISQCSDYMEMTSPTDGYMNMNPLSTSVEQQSFLKPTTLDSNLTPDGYIHMAPIRDHHSISISNTTQIPHNEGYLDMAPLSSSLPKAFSVISNPGLSISSRKDSSSKLSETPTSSPSSSNLEDFQLDKVQSFLADTDDSESYIRPARSYSMGSRPQPKKSHLPVQVDGSRIRAYSVGSKGTVGKKPAEKEISNLMKMDSRGGSKSSSAPLLNNRPPRAATVSHVTGMRSNSSRGELNEDLMEIDYNRISYAPPGIDIFDSNFTIEPVGRSRSGSYSSANSSLKSFLDGNKAKSFSYSPGKEDSTSDYLSMSPISEPSTKKQPFSYSSPSSKKAEILHPPGDYVSLDPSSTYEPVPVNISLQKVVSGISMSQQRSQRSQSPLPDVPELKPVSDYMCMDLSQSSSKSPEVATVKPAKSPDSAFFKSAKSRENVLSKSTEKSKLHQVKESSVPPSPTNKSPQSMSIFYIPRTPPSSPSYGAMSQETQPITVETVMRRLSQPSKTSELSPNDANRLSGSEVMLHYASLDLPPASQDDAKGSKLWKSSSEGDAKDPPLMYAQIDFSPVKQKPFQESESLSHL